MYLTTYLTVFLLMISPFVGSFLAVLVDRLPRGEDVVATRSACRACGVPLKPWQLLPIVSFALQRGRCGACTAAIPPWLLYVEVLAIGAAVLVVIKGGDSAALVLNAAFLWLLIGLAATDLKWFRLPDVLNAALAMVAFGLAVIPGGIGLWDATLGALIGAGSFLALRLAYEALRGREGLGLGDVKLMIGLGAFVGPYDLPILVLIAALAALGVATLEFLSNRSALNAGRAMPFGTALCAAAAMLWVLS